jgi:dolichol-phosphate mannosyltransferase
MSKATQKLALITPVFNEVENLDRYADEVRSTLVSHADLDLVVLFVDDGSTDGSWQVITRITKDDPRFRGIRLSRNFGSHVAIGAGFDHLEDDVDAAVVLAADLQDPPETVLEFVERWRDGAEIVWGRRTTRLDSRWRVLASRIFHRMLRRHAMPPGSKFTTGSFFLIDRKVIDAVTRFAETNRITFALVAWTGFEQDVVEYSRRKREAGVSGWSFTDMIRAFYDAFVGFSGLPIKLMERAALLSFFVAFGLAAYVVIAALIRETRVPGWTSQMLLLAVFFGVQFWLIAILGQYLARIHREVVRRPLYFVSRDTSMNEESRPRESGTSNRAKASELAHEGGD